MDGKFAGAAVASHASIHLKRKVPIDSAVVNWDFDKHLSKSTTIKDFESRVSGLLRTLGIDRWSHINANSIVDGLDVCGAWPAGLINHYAKEECYRDDLLIRHAMVSNLPIFTHEVCAHLRGAPVGLNIFARFLEFDKAMQKYGVKTALAIPIVRRRHKAIFTVSATQLDIEAFQSSAATNLSVLQAVANAVDEVGHKLFNTSFHGKKLKAALGIDPKHLKLLSTMATKDLTLNEAAEVLDISISTANQQIAAVKNALGMDTTQGAIMAVLRKGYIDVESC